MIALGVSIQEYLETSYSPDVEFVDGEILERNVGQTDHSYTQLELGWVLRSHFGRSPFTLIEQRTQVNPTRVRVPDLSVVERLEKSVTRTPPLLCVEILSPDDRWPRLQKALNDYLAMGVPLIWVIDPWERQAWHVRPNGIYELTDGILAAPHLNLTVELASVLPPLTS